MSWPTMDVMNVMNGLRPGLSARAAIIDYMAAVPAALGSSSNDDATTHSSCGAPRLRVDSRHEVVPFTRQCKRNYNSDNRR